jgi:hypothetical protein
MFLVQQDEEVAEVRREAEALGEAEVVVDEEEQEDSGAAPVVDVGAVAGAVVGAEVPEVVGAEVPEVEGAEGVVGVVE